MKAFTSLLAVLLMLSSTSLGQNSQSQQTSVGESASKPAAASQPPAPPSTTSTGASTASAGTAPAARIPLGAKVFIEPTGGFELYLRPAIFNRRVPVVLANDRAEADFILSGTAYVERPGLAKAILVSPAPHGKADITIKDAHTGTLVLAYSVDEPDPMMTIDQIYQNSAVSCARHLKKVMEKK